MPTLWSEGSIVLLQGQRNMTSASTTSLFPRTPLHAITLPRLHPRPIVSLPSLSQFVPSTEFLTPHLRIPYPAGGSRRLRRPSTGFVVFAVQSNFFRVIQTICQVGKDGIKAGTDLVPDSVPRPVARIGVAVVALSVILFVLKSFLSTAFFVLATMGLIYFTYIALNKDSGPKGGGTTSKMDDPVEEAKKIMEKYNK